MRVILQRLKYFYITYMKPEGFSYDILVIELKTIQLMVRTVLFFSSFCNINNKNSDLHV